MEKFTSKHLPFVIVNSLLFRSFNFLITISILESMVCLREFNTDLKDFIAMIASIVKMDYLSIDFSIILLLSPFEILRY